MPGVKTQILIVGGSLGGVSAAIAAAEMGVETVLAADGNWLGGQLTSQAVPPDENQWIETVGCTARYQKLRSLIRAAYRAMPEYIGDGMNPGGGWVSRLCFEPLVGVRVIENWLAALPSLKVLKGLLPIEAESIADRVASITFIDAEGRITGIEADYILDATETGDLLPMVGAEYRVGAEARSETGEPNALETADPTAQQAITWCMAVQYDPASDHTIEKPKQYDFWRSFQPSFWPGPLLSMTTADPITGQAKTWEPMELFDYRRIVDGSQWNPARHSATILNWPQNDYFLGPIVDVDEETRKERSEGARQLTLSLLYYLQTERGMTGLRPCGDLTGTSDGFAQAPYIRESRRIVSRFTVLQQHIAGDRNSAEHFPDSVGIGHYRIDLHPRSPILGYLDVAALPFQIPLGALIPVRLTNLLPACKNIGTTHITNGCYRLHPVEWNIGEASGALAAHCFLSDVRPGQVYEDKGQLEGFQILLSSQGVRMGWVD
ncbi:MAG: FAD-dependent oxidoreductase [Armatimonadetes bacterium]|nr:FAD-dependent oxidoreductase [Armatimonadota bacterium]